MRWVWAVSSWSCLGLNEVRPRRPEQFEVPGPKIAQKQLVSMKSGLEGRNNNPVSNGYGYAQFVSMKSGLEGRNNDIDGYWISLWKFVSMKSGLEGRNNPPQPGVGESPVPTGLNEVRPRRPEQYRQSLDPSAPDPRVSMKSGLEGRNNTATSASDRKPPTASQ